MYKIYCELRDKNEKKDADVAKATGITKSTFSDWKSGRSTPKQDKLQKIAEYFNVSVDYLMTGNNDTSINSSTSKFSNKNSLTTKDEKDIRKKVDDILSQLNNDEALMFDGEPMNDETKELLRASLENSVQMAKITAKKKFTPKKYRWQRWYTWST